MPFEKDGADGVSFEVFCGQTNTPLWSCNDNPHPGTVAGTTGGYGADGGVFRRDFMKHRIMNKGVTWTSCVMKTKQKVPEGEKIIANTLVFHDFTSLLKKVASK